MPLERWCGGGIACVWLRFMRWFRSDVNRGGAAIHGETCVEEEEKPWSGAEDAAEEAAAAAAAEARRRSSRGELRFLPPFRCIVACAFLCSQALLNDGVCCSPAIRNTAAPVLARVAIVFLCHMYVTRRRLQPHYRVQ